MIREPLDATRVRLTDALRRREQGLPPADDEVDLLERAIKVIEQVMIGHLTEVAVCNAVRAAQSKGVAQEKP